MINALMPGEHDWIQSYDWTKGPVASSAGAPWTPSPSVPAMAAQSARGANVPGKKPNPLMNALGVAATTLFSNDPAASFQRKRDMQLGNALALNDYEGAAQMALKAGNLDQGMALRDAGTAYAEQQKKKEEELLAKRAEAAKGERKRSGVIAFLASCIAELRRVQWPDRETLIQATAVTLVFVIVAALYLGVLDLAFNWLVQRVI